MFTDTTSPGVVEKVTDIVIGFTMLALALAGWAFYFTSRNVGMVDVLFCFAVMVVVMVMTRYRADSKPTSATLP